MTKQNPTGRPGDDGLKEIRLGNLADGELERKFQQRLLEVAEIFNESGRFQDANDIVVSKIKLEVECHKNVVTGQIAMFVSSDLKAPKEKLVGSPAHLRDGGQFYAQQQPVQTEIELPGNVAPITKEGTNGGA